MALNGIYSSDKAEKLAHDNNLIKHSPQYNKLFKYNNVIIDTSSHVEYTVKTKEKLFQYKSDADFGERILDRISNRTIVFDIQHVGDYLLFGEDTKITCFNLKQEKPCEKVISKTKATTNTNSDGTVRILMDQLYFYNDKKSNYIFQCTTGVAFNNEKDAAKCEGRKYINLDSLM